MIPPSEISRVADGLSAIAKRDLLEAEPKWRGEDEIFLRGKGQASWKAVEELRDAGLATIVMRGVMLTDKGERVRTHLETQNVK